MEMSLMILAAGMGSRFGGLKQMQGFGPHGETLLEYSVYDALRCGIRHAVFIIRESMEQDFQEKVVDRLKGRIETDLVFQEPELTAEETALAGSIRERSKPWGTGHALKVGLEAVRGPFLVLNADDFYGSGALAAGAAFLEKSSTGFSHALVAYRLDRTLSPHGTVSRGVLAVDESGRLTGIRERHQIERKTEGIQYLDARTKIKYRLGGETQVSLNLLGLRPEVGVPLEQAWRQFLQNDAAVPGAEFGIPDVLSAALEANQNIAVVGTGESWMGVTHPDDAAWVRHALQERVDAGVYPAPLWGESD